MSNKDYVGYSLFDKVIIVAKQRFKYEWEGEVCHTIALDEWQGYVVDPSNKSMLKSALEWGKQTKSIYENGKWSRSEEIPPEQFEFDNRDWTLELLRVADGSSQGGKLSFWNCKLTKGDKTFEIGINADLLLDVLKSHTFHHGKCVGSLMFARCKGGVGLLSEDMPEYQQALADMRKKQDIKNKKTSKHVVGHAYTALKEVHAYIGDLYAWYEPVIAEKPYGGWGGTRTVVVGFRKLKEPVKYQWFPSLYNWEPGKQVQLSKITHLSVDHYNLRTKLPARIDAGEVVEFDITLEEACQKFFWDQLERDMTGQYKRSFYASDPLFFSTNSENFEMPDKYVKLLAAAGYWVED